MRSLRWLPTVSKHGVGTMPSVSRRGPRAIIAAVRRAGRQLRGAIGGSAAIAWSVCLVGGCVPEGPPTGSEPTAPPTSSEAVTSDDAPVRIEPAPALEGPFRDDFDRDRLGDDWHALSDAWRIRGGELCAQGARNRGVWLRRRIPVNARIELDARSGTSEGDIKLELWGDGQSGARKASYDHASGYLAIFGGWSNSRHVLARLDEHGPDRRATAVRDDTGGAQAPVVAGRTYHFRIERRDGSTLRWWVDDVLMHTFPDPSPLSGPGHDHVGLNDWLAPVCFDNFEVTPL